ncbi:MAG: aminotransferase class III-fold pyridoxal phosphate-dependent enzyme, partial [Polyangiaceae bacterium]|nr:aminotransferase class III-fold pyridoxal phosphate-dependent enzyme [Polyangiaceae bacterium]
GHCHPRVVEAGQRQIARLNTNTRYLYEELVEYAERLTATLPEPLDTCFFVNSGSEANELALRLAMTHTGRRDLLVVDGAYHGNTSRLIEVSPYKFMGKGGTGKPEPWVHVVPLADGYRGAHRGFGRETGAAYGDEVGEIIARSNASIAGFLTESLLSCGGQVIPPEGYLETAFRHVHAAGGLCIVDEVQVGFGRVGTHFWGFEAQGVVPDIVVMGKPIGNGHPMGAVVTTRAIAESFANGMEYFATFGGNPVSCAIGLAVLDVLRDERLQAHALEVGTRLRDGLRALAAVHPIVGDVRGLGLFIGCELVRDRSTLEPAAREATELVNRMRARGILLSTDGPLNNVIKIKPPMVLTADDVDMVIRVFDDELGRLETR